MNIIVRKITGIDSLRKANSFTTGNESKMSLAKAYALGHSPIRTQWFEIEMYDIPLFVASQLVRQTQGVQWYQRSKRTDRGGENFDAAIDVITDALHEEKECVANGDYDTTLETLQSAFQNAQGLRNRFDRNSPTDLFCQINAEALMNMARKRLCTKASEETRGIVANICELVEEQDPDLAPHLVRPCVACGVCREAKPCGFMASEKYQAQRKFYKSIFKPKV